MQTETAQSPASYPSAPYPESDDVLVDLKASMLLLLFVAVIGMFGAGALLFSIM